MSIGDNPGPIKPHDFTLKQFMEIFGDNGSLKCGYTTIGNYWPAPGDAALEIHRQNMERLHFALRNWQTLDRMAIHAMNAILKTAR